MASVTQNRIPPLENGDRLSRDEFERRYDAMPNVKKAELIEGIVSIPSHVDVAQLGTSRFDLIGWLGAYEGASPGVQGADNASIRLDLENIPQPDVCLFIDPSLGGQARISEDDYIEDAPEFIGEVAASRVSDDTTTKLQVYRRNSVREYLIWRVQDRAIDWYVLRGSLFVKQEPDADGLYRSKVFPGLWLDASALIRGDAVAVRTALERGLASPEHAAFVQQLAARKPS